VFLLDTNVLSELRKSATGRADARVVQWASLVDDDLLFVSAITLFELELGVLRMERQDKTQGARLRAWLNGQVLAQFADRTLSVDATVALRCASLHVPDPRPERDALIAATALVHGMTVVTRNVADFVPMGVLLLNPWE
jgi:predicted nucleic acid-binding protein